MCATRGQPAKLIASDLAIARTARYERRQRSAIQTGQWARRGAAGGPMGRPRRRRLGRPRRRSAASDRSNAATKTPRDKSGVRSDRFGIHTRPTRLILSQIASALHLRGVANEFTFGDSWAEPGPRRRARASRAAVPSFARESEREAGKCFRQLALLRDADKETPPTFAPRFVEATRRVGRPFETREDYRSASSISYCISNRARLRRCCSSVLVAAASRIMRITRSDGYQWLLSDDDRRSWRNVRK